MILLIILNPLNLHSMLGLSQAEFIVAEALLDIRAV